MVFEKPLEDSRDTGEMDTSAQVCPSAFREWWLEEPNVLSGQPLHPMDHSVQIFMDASKEGWGAHIEGQMARGYRLTSDSRLHINILELKAVLLALRKFQSLVSGKIVLIAADNTTSCPCLYQHRRGHEVRSPLHPIMETTDLVRQACSNPESQVYPRSPDCGSRQPFPE